MLTEGTDYLFFRSAFHSGAQHAEVAVVATRRWLFLAPVEDGEAIARYLASPPPAVEALEAELRRRVGGDRAIELGALASLTVWSRFLRQVRFKRDREATQVLALRGKANHDRFASFYAEALARRTLRA
jgi:hypothetical protein